MIRSWCEKNQEKWTVAAFYVQNSTFYDAMTHLIYKAKLVVKKMIFSTPAFCQN